MVYINVIFLWLYFIGNLSKIKGVLNLIRLHNIVLLNEQICEESSFSDEKNLSWKTIKISLSTLILENKKIYFYDGDEFSRNNHRLEFLVDFIPI